MTDVSISSSWPKVDTKHLKFASNPNLQKAAESKFNVSKIKSKWSRGVNSDSTVSVHCHLQLFELKLEPVPSIGGCIIWYRETAISHKWVLILHISSVTILGRALSNFDARFKCWPNLRQRQLEEGSSLFKSFRSAGKCNWTDQAWLYQTPNDY